MTRFAFLLLALIPPGLALAQADYPSKPIRVVVPAPGGSAVDVVMRTLTEKLPALSGQPWVVDNRPGAGGTIAADVVAKAPADGYTLLFTANNFIIAPSLYPVRYDIYKDFTPIGIVAAGQDMIFVNADTKVKSLQELIALAKRTPGGLNYGAPFVGTAAHLTMELLKQSAGIPMTFIPGSGGPQSFSDAVAGRVPLVIGSALAGLGLVKGGRLNALVVVDTKRSPLAPEIPTLAEEGFPKLSQPLWFALYGPGRLPAPIVQRIGADVTQVVRSKEVADALVSRGFEGRPGTPAELEALMRESQPMFAKVIQDVGIKAQ